MQAVVVKQPVSAALMRDGPFTGRRCSHCWGRSYLLPGRGRGRVEAGDGDGDGLQQLDPVGREVAVEDVGVRAVGVVPVAPTAHVRPNCLFPLFPLRVGRLRALWHGVSGWSRLGATTAPANGRVSWFLRSGAVAALPVAPRVRDGEPRPRGQCHNLVPEGPYGWDKPLLLPTVGLPPSCGWFLRLAGLRLTTAWVRATGCVVARSPWPC